MIAEFKARQQERQASRNYRLRDFWIEAEAEADVTALIERLERAEHRLARLLEVGRGLQRHGTEAKSEFYSLVGLGFVCAADVNGGETPEEIESFGRAWTAAYDGQGH